MNSVIRGFLAGALLALAVHVASAQPLEVLTNSTDSDLDVDRGSTGLWQRLLKLRTTASVLHTTAHPDDEHAGLLTYLSRGAGARTALLTLNRGEAGANAIGSELFDALGLIRTEELRLAARWYGLDDQYFSSALDYGYSKTLDETLRSWDRQRVLGEMVRVLRTNRPLVVVSRFHGSTRDGHGNHQAVGGLTPEAVRAAGDPAAFPEQISEEGLRPWQPRKHYRGGIRETERWHVAADVGAHSPWLGASYENFGRYGLSLQRSQTGGRARDRMGPVVARYERLDTDNEGSEEGFFDGLDTSISGIFSVAREEAPDGGTQLLATVQAHVERAVESASLRDPAGVVGDLVEGLRATRELLALIAAESDAAFLLRVKERQFEHAIHTALGIRLEAVAVEADAETDGSPWAAIPTMGAVVPGQTFKVQVRLHNPSQVAVSDVDIRLEDGSAWAAESDEVGTDPVHAIEFTVRVPDEPEFSRRYFFRESIRENHYRWRDARYAHRPARPPALTAAASYTVGGVRVEASTAVRALEANLPYGYVRRELKVAPALAVNVQPRQRIVAAGRQGDTLRISVELLNNNPGGSEGELRLETPEGWQAVPQAHSFAFRQAGQRRGFAFRVALPALERSDYEVRAVASAGGRTYREGYRVIRHRDLETRYIYRDARVSVRGVDVRTAPGLRVGYVMGVGDEVPSGIEQLGAEVTLLSERDLASGDLAAYDAVVIGTRAYAVRQDLHTYNERLLDWAFDGGNLIVLYQTQEFVPEDMAPFSARLPRGAEEVSEEDAPVTVLRPDHPVFRGPNVIGPADFDGWVEQRGSKFFTEWDSVYVPLVELSDSGQAPQRGAWVHARHGKGHWTYFALAIHRQVPYAVPGPYRILANLLSMGK